MTTTASIAGTAANPQKRPRIDELPAALLTQMRPNEPFERAANDALRELHDARMMLAESILDLEGQRGSLAEWEERREELALHLDARGLVRVLRLRLRDRGVELP